MKITSVSVYQVDLPLHEGSYSWSGGKSVEIFDSTVVRIDTDEGIAGFGEVCPLGPFYLPSYAAGARAGLGELAPHLIGQDPCAPDRINHLMDLHLKGHPYVKSALDMACWDIFGKTCGQSVCTLLGGKDGDAVTLYRAISQDTPEKMAASVLSYRGEGYSRFQLKVGGDPDQDVDRIYAAAEQLQPSDALIADANTGWLPHQAVRVVRAVKELDVYIEQPCLSYEECLSVRHKCSHPFVLDESIDSIESLLRAHYDQAMDVINIKISKLGGLTKARRLRDLAVDIGLGLTIEDSWGGDIVTAAIAHLAHSTRAQNRFTATDFNSYVTVSLADGAPSRDQGRMAASDSPGLGITPREDVLGAAVAIYDRAG